MKIKSTAISLVALLAALPHATLAGQIELRSADGFLTINGEYIDFDGSLLTVRTGHGEIKIPTEGMMCLGESCPSSIAQEIRADDLTVAFGNITDRDLMMMLLSAEQVNASTGTEINLSGSEATIRALESFQTASLRLLPAGEADDTGVTISATIPSADLPIAYAGPAGWASTEKVTSHMVAAQALVVVVAPSTGIEALSPEEVARVYAGEITNWSELGGNDVAVQPIKVDVGTQALANLQAGIASPFGLGIHADVLTVASEADAMDVLNYAPGAIAVVSQASLNDSAPLPITNACGQNIEPETFAINNGSYPLTLTTFASYAVDVETDVMPRVFDAVSRTEMQLMLTNAGYSDPRIVAAPVASKAARVEPLLAGHVATTPSQDARAVARILENASVLSIRFVDGNVTSVIGARNRADFVRLAEAIDQGVFDGQEVLFVGYPATPFSGTADAQAAADEMLAAFQEFAPLAAARDRVVLTALGHPVAPVDLCQVDRVSDTATTVEIWVRPTR